MKWFKKIQWLSFIAILAIGLVVVSCKDNNNPITPEVDVDPTEGEFEAGLENGIFLSNSLSLSYEKSIGSYTFKVYAGKAIDADALLGEIDANDDAETIQSKIDAKRIALYPDEEIFIDVAGEAGKPKETPANVSGYVYIVRQVYWWNNYNRYNYYWISTMSANSTSLFFRVTSGSYALYRNSNGSWSYYGTVYAGTTAALATSGYNNVKGFKGIGRSSSNRADIVMYFFR